MHELKELAAITALNKMMQDGYLSICTIDAVAKMLHVQCQQTEEYRMLHALHCVHFTQMPVALQQEIPALIQRCLGRGPEFQFASLRKEVIEVNGGWMRRLIGSH